MSASAPISHIWSSGYPVSSAAFLMGAIARKLAPASAAINAMTIPLRIQPVRCMACELPCASMLMFTLLDIIATERTWRRRSAMSAFDRKPPSAHLNLKSGWTYRADPALDLGWRPFVHIKEMRHRRLHWLDAWIIEL